MKNLFLRATIIIIVFFATWFLLDQIDWMGIFKVEETSSKIEQKLGKQIWEFIQLTEEEVEDEDINLALDSILSHICSANNIDKDYIKLHLIQKSEINAFALPDGHLVVYSGLIEAAENETELDGVLCHEIAHIELNHVMQKLMREIGLSVLIANVSGKGGPNNTLEIAKSLSSNAFDRSLERDADMKAVDYMIEAGINPEGFAEFMYKLSLTEPEAMQYLEWVSSHPETQARAEYIIEYSNYQLEGNGAVLADTTWKMIQWRLNF